MADGPMSLFGEDKLDGKSGALPILFCPYPYLYLYLYLRI